MGKRFIRYKNCIIDTHRIPKGWNNSTEGERLDAIVHREPCCNGWWSINMSKLQELFHELNQEL
jgi:hypothetical protein